MAWQQEPYLAQRDEKEIDAYALAPLLARHLPQRAAEVYGATACSASAMAANRGGNGSGGSTAGAAAGGASATASAAVQLGKDGGLQEEDPLKALRRDLRSARLLAEKLLEGAIAAGGGEEALVLEAHVTRVLAKVRKRHEIT